MLYAVFLKIDSPRNFSRKEDLAFCCFAVYTNRDGQLKCWKESWVFSSVIGWWSGNGGGWHGRPHTLFNQLYDENGILNNKIGAFVKNTVCALNKFNFWHHIFQCMYKRFTISTTNTTTKGLKQSKNQPPDWNLFFFPVQRTLLHQNDHSRRLQSCWYCITI